LFNAGVVRSTRPKLSILNASSMLKSNPPVPGLRMVCCRGQLTKGMRRLESRYWRETMILRATYVVTAAFF
jgi:hypothetical protein